MSPLSFTLLDNICDYKIGLVVKLYNLVSTYWVKRLWKLVGKWWGMELDTKNSIQEIIDVGNRRGINTKGQSRWIATAWSFLYFIWVNRNNLIFKNVNIAVEELFFAFQLKSYEWVIRRGKEISVDMGTWLTNPYGS